MVEDLCAVHAEPPPCPKCSEQDNHCVKCKTPIELGLTICKKCTDEVFNK